MPSSIISRIIVGAGALGTAAIAAVSGWFYSATPPRDVPKKDPVTQEAVKPDTTKQEVEKQDAAKQEAARQEATKQEAVRQEAAKQEAAKRRLAAAKAGVAMSRAEANSGIERPITGAQAKAYLRTLGDAANAGQFTLAARQLADMSDEDALAIYQKLIRLGARPDRIDDSP